MVILDANIIIDQLKQPFDQSKLAKLVSTHPQEELCISLVTIQELYAGHSTKNPNKEKELTVTLSGLKVLPYTYDIAKLAGTLVRDSKHPVEMADAAIAATAISHHAPLYTLNTKHFTTFPALKLYQP